MTMGAVILTGCAGLLINIIIASTYGAESLGIFNMAYAVLVICSQLGALGIPMAILKYLSEFATQSVRPSIALTGTLITGVSASALATILYLSSDKLGTLMNSQDLAKAAKLIAPAIMLLAVNKNLFSQLNALREMKDYSQRLALRPILILIFLASLILLGAPSWSLCGALTLSETFVFGALIRSNIKCFHGASLKGIAAWLPKLITFGVKGLPGGLLAEINTRLDILILGLFVSDAQVGIYSLAAMLTEGIYQIPYVFRLNIDPLITRHYVKGHLIKLKSLIQRGAILSFPAMLGVAACASFIYPHFAGVLTSQNTFMEGVIPFQILMFGVVVQGGFMPFSGVLTQCGRPGLQTVVLLSMTVINCLANLLLIPIWGLAGAATATTISACLGVLLTLLLIQKELKINLLPHFSNMHA